MMASARRKQIEAVAREGAENPDREARSWKRLPDEELAIEAEVSAHGSHFVLEKLAQRLDQREAHALGQAANVMMALDHRRRPADGDRLDHVRIQGPLCQIVEAPELVRLGLEDIDKRRADDLALLPRDRSHRRAAPGIRSTRRQNAPATATACNAQRPGWPR